jgi:DNA-directed RNA polymerase alpha subunit
MNTDMITYKELKEAVIVIELYMQQLQEGLKRVEAYNSTKLATLIGENDLTIRTLNVLRRHGIFEQDTMESLSKLSRRQLRKTRQCGKKTIIEIEELCNKAGITLSE